MSFSFISVFVLLFPLSLLAGGTYLAYLGYLSRTSAFSDDHVVCGKVRCESPFPSHISAIPCAFSRIVIEYFDEGAFVHVCTLEKKAHFQIGQRPVDPHTSSFDLLRYKLFQGIAKPDDAPEFAIFESYMKQSGLGKAAQSLASYYGPSGAQADSGTRKNTITRDILFAILRSPGSAPVRKHLNKMLRVKEYVLEDGSDACIVIPPSGESSGSVVTDSGPEQALSSLREKSLMKIAVGTALILISLATLLYIFI